MAKAKTKKKSTTTKKYAKKPKSEIMKESMTDAAIHKGDFRKSKRWFNFRTWLKTTQKYDPVTGSKLTKGANCHHKDMREENYENLDPRRFVELNPKTHNVVHFLFATRDWRKALQELEKILTDMERFNSDVPNWSYDDENNSAFPG